MKSIVTPIPLKHKLLCIGISCNISRQANGGRSLSGGVNTSGCKFVYILSWADAQNDHIDTNEEELTCNIWDLLVPGSPTSSTLISPR